MDQMEYTRRVDGGGSVVIIAEVGVNHDGDPRTAHELVDVAARAGADIVKFQTFTPQLLASADAPTAAYQRRTTNGDSQRDLIAGLALPEPAWRKLAEHCRDAGVGFASTAFDGPSLEVVLALGIPFLKVASGEITNLPFIRQLAAVGMPLLISTGMSTLEEVEAAVTAAAAAPQISLLHCVSCYPAPAEDVNLRAITTMQAHFGVPVGWSDHTVDSRSALVAVALGARVLEKHITLDPGRSGPDHAASADPAMFASYVEAVRWTEIMLGDGEKRPQNSEQDVMRVARRAWHAAHDLPAGTILRNEHLRALRPAAGVPPSEDLDGRVLEVDVLSGTPIHRHHLA